MAVVYYAGHGVQVDRENYLIPADAKLERERDLLYEAMPLDRLLGEVSQASQIGIVLLDSCRNNPFIERVARSMTIAGRAVATTPGLARVDNVPRNTMVVMAAKADQIAEDGRSTARSPPPCWRISRSPASNSACSSAACGTPFCAPPTIARNPMCSAPWVPIRSTSTRVRRTGRRRSARSSRWR